VAAPKFAHGLIVGKFYPPHLGHHRLIDWAAAQCGELTVLAMAARGESLPLADRTSWLQAHHAGQAGVVVLGVSCDAPVDFGDESVWTAQVAIIQAALRAGRRPLVDAVFASEGYGEQLAARLSAAHRSFDPDRRLSAIAASGIRADAASHWDEIAATTRAGLATRVVLLGAESTGTTTIARQLTDRYRGRGRVWGRTRCVAEYGREVTRAKWTQARQTARTAGQVEPALDELVWTADDFDLVAREQTRREEEAAANGSPLLVCDTDAFATSVWERRYLGEQARPLQPWATALLPRRDVYLLTSHDGVPWHDDGLREGDLAIRAAMTAWFSDALTQAGHSWVLLTGDLDQRLGLATRTVERLLLERLTFTAAITDPAPQALGRCE
jgi:HTH-type transcriptional repressor of NAD biosynthesis genes